MARGACNCGAVSFTISDDVSGVIVCHCSICRRATGSNGIAVVVVDSEKFEWTCGEELITSWKKPGADWAMSFCGRCGSPVPGVNDDTRTFVPAGLINEGGDNLKVAHHIWVDSRATWDELGDCGRRHAEAFEG
ncbi:MAG: GFA family protein [Woeseiaceae bacterium]